MASFRRGDVIKVPFPYTDRPTRQTRPALVVSSSDIEDAHGLLWVLMITSAENRGWRGDLPVDDLAGAGLPAASLIRCAKIAAIQASDAVRLGRVSASLLRQVNAALRRQLALPAAAA